MTSALRSLATRAARISTSSRRAAAALSLSAFACSSATGRRALSVLATRAEWQPTHLTARGFAKAAKGKSGKADKQQQAQQGGGGETDEAAVKALFDKTTKNMHGAVLQFTRALAQMRPGKADAGMFDELHVQAYGAHVALSQVAQVAVVSSHAVSVNVYDPSLLPDIKKAVEAMNPVFSVREDNTALHVSFPKMSKETRAELIKAAKKQAEQSRQHVRRVRQEAMNSAKKFKEHMSEDDVKKQQDDIQKLTDDAIAEIAKLLAAKEKDLVEV